MDRWTLCWEQTWMHCGHASPITEWPCIYLPHKHVCGVTARWKGSHISPCNVELSSRETFTDSHLVSEKSISGSLQKLTKKRIASYTRGGVCGKCGQRLDRMRWLLSGGISPSRRWPSLWTSGPPCWTDPMSLARDEWSDFIFRLGDVALRDRRFFKAWNPSVC